MSHGGEQNINASASDMLSSRATSVSASRVGITPSFAMSTVTSPFGFTDGAASRVDVSISPPLAMVKMTNSFGVIGAAASYIAIYTSPSFTILAMVTKPPAEPEDDHSLDSDVFKSLGVLYSQLCCTPSCKAPNNEAVYESIAVDFKESALVSQRSEHNIIATPIRKRLSSKATSVSASRMGINPSFAMFTVTSPYGFTDGTTSRVNISTSPSLRTSNHFGVIGVASSYVAMYTSPSFAVLAVMTKLRAGPDDDHSSDSDVSKSLSLLYSQLCYNPSRKAPSINAPAVDIVNFNQSAAHGQSDITQPSLVVSLASCQSSYSSLFADGSFLSGASMDSYENLLSSESYDLHTSKGATALLYQSSANDVDRNKTRLVVSPAASLASCLSFSFLAGDYDSGGVSCDSIYSNGEPLGLDLEPLYYDRDDLQDDDSDAASVFSLGLDGDDSQYGQWRFTFVRPAQDIVQVSNNTIK